MHAGFTVEVHDLDPIMMIRCQSGLPAVGEVLEPFAYPHLVSSS